ncbi:hypothetical protein YC2023_077991 [Brassica napus]
MADTDRVDGWISNVLARGSVSDLDLAIAIGSDEEDNYQLSPKCFECSTLVSLKMHRGIDISLVAGRILLCDESLVRRSFVTDSFEGRSDDVFKIKRTNSDFDQRQVLLAENELLAIDVQR